MINSSAISFLERICMPYETPIYGKLKSRIDKTKFHNNLLSFNYHYINSLRTTMVDLREAKICYGCGEKWNHANQYNHLCNVCRHKNGIQVKR